MVRINVVVSTYIIALRAVVLLDVRLQLLQLYQLFLVLLL